MRVLGVVWVGTRTNAFDETVDFFRDVLGVPMELIAPDFGWSRLPDSSQLEVFGPGDDEHRRRERRIRDSPRHSADGTMLPMSDVRRPSPAEDGLMAQQLDHRRRATAEERQFLEALVFLRGLYAARGPRDRAPVVGIGSLIADAERRMRSVSLNPPT